MELICAIAILGIVTASIGSVMVVSARNYQRGSDEVGLQQEAQITANQIADLVIDSTAGVSYACPEGACMNEAEALALGAAAGGDRTLTIDSNGHRFAISFREADNKIYYAEYIINPDDTVTPYESEQLMAENVKLFTADITNFADNGYLELRLGFEKGERTYEAAFTINARNGAVEASGGEAAASIATETDIVLEPSQAYDLDVSVIGPADTGVAWSMSGNTSANTVLLTNPSTGKMQIKIGTDETASEIRLLVRTNAKKPDGVTPQAQQTITVHIRRVTAVSLNVVLESGAAMEAGAIYRIDASVTGTNLDQLLGTASDMTPYDYMDPYKVEWEYLYSIDGREVGGADHAWESPEVYFSVLDASPTSTRIQLNRRLENNYQLLVTAISQHSEGEAGAPLVRTNKTGVKYARVYGSHLFMRTMHELSGDKLYRSTDVQQGWVALDSIKGLVIAKYGNGDYKMMKYYRFREIISMNEDTGEMVFGPWVNWAPMTAEVGGAALNLRPEQTLRFECNKDYQVQIKYVMYDGWDVNNVKWPFADTPENANVVDAIIRRIKLAFDIPALGVSSARGLGTKESPVVIPRGEWGSTNPIYISIVDEGAEAWGVNLPHFQNNLGFRVEKLVDGEWVPVDSSECTLNRRCNIYQSQEVRWNSAGLYRIIPGLVDMPYITYNYATGASVENRKDYWLDNEETGEGIFYFKVE